MNVIMKEINGVKYALPESLYENLFTNIILEALENGNTLATVFIGKESFKYQLLIPLKECVEMCNNLDETLITKLIQAGLTDKYLIQTPFTPLPKRII